MQDLIVILVVAVIIGLACRYIYKEKKNGKKCIGCSEACSCSGKGSCKESRNGKE